MPPERSTSSVSTCRALEDINLFSTDLALQEAMSREGAAASGKRLVGFGLVTGSAEVIDRGRVANAHPPELTSFDRNGTRCDRITYHPAYHDLMDMSTTEGLQATAWLAAASQEPVPRPGLYVERAGALYMAAQADAGHLSSISMTHSCVAALSHHEALAAKWVPKAASRSHDRNDGALAGKVSGTLSLAITEPAALATPLSRDAHGALYALSGLAWNVVAPAADGLIVLAQVLDGASKARAAPSCFLIPRYSQDGQLNACSMRQLKDTIGLRSQATADIDLNGAQAWLLGEAGSGVEVLTETVLHARFDSVVVTAGLMRQCVAQALNYSEHEREGGVALCTNPLMQQTLADMALDAEVAAALGFRLARAFDRASDERAAAWRRLMTPVASYWVSRRAPILAAETMDCFASNGVLEDWPAARLYRDCAAVSSAGGSAMTMALEVLRILQREPGIAQTVLEELSQGAGDDPHLRAAHDRIEAILHAPRHLDARGRLLLESLATLAAGTIFRAQGLTAVGDAFIKSRMGNQPRQSYGQGLEWADTAAIVRRASPHQS